MQQNGVTDQTAVASDSCAESADDPLDWQEYESFLQECFPENIKTNDAGDVVWFDRRVVGDWRQGKCEQKQPPIIHLLPHFCNAQYFSA